MMATEQIAIDLSSPTADILPVDFDGQHYEVAVVEHGWIPTEYGRRLAVLLCSRCVSRSEPDTYLVLRYETNPFDPREFGTWVIVSHPSEARLPLGSVDDRPTAHFSHRWWLNACLARHGERIPGGS